MAEPVAMPTADVYIQVGATGMGEILVLRVRQLASGYLVDNQSPEEARDFAEALLAAADKAEARAREDAGEE